MSTFKSWEDPNCGGCRLAAGLRDGGGGAGAGCADHGQPPVPEHVAAFAVCLHHCGFGTWADIAPALAAIGLGRYRHEDLKQVCVAWDRENIAPSVARTIRAHFTKSKRRTR